MYNVISFSQLQNITIKYAYRAAMHLKEKSNTEWLWSRTGCIDADNANKISRMKYSKHQEKPYAHSEKYSSPKALFAYTLGEIKFLP